MALLRATCLGCGKTFQTARKGAKFCSNACVGIGKHKGIVGSKKRRGTNLVCEVCGGEFYRKPYHVKAGRNRFCSEKCRKRAYKLNMIDSNVESMRQKKQTGKTVTCMFCGTTVYRKDCYIKRNVNKTCGSSICMSAYGRSLWGQDPFSLDIILLPRPKRRFRGSRQKGNFTAKQRAEWIDDKCARCGTTTNLALDHIIPVCAGGQPTRKNAQTLCQPCNNWKAEYVDKPLALKNNSFQAAKANRT